MLKKQKTNQNLSEEEKDKLRKNFTEEEKEKRYQY